MDRAEVARQEMEVFDNLPKSIRDKLNNATVGIPSLVAAEAYGAAGQRVASIVIQQCEIAARKYYAERSSIRKPAQKGAKDDGRQGSESVRSNA